MTDIPPELPPAGGAVPQGQPQGGQPTGLREALTPLAQTPSEKFLAALMSVGQETGTLDDAFREPSIEDEADEQDPNPNPLELLNEQQIIELVELFLAIPEPERSQMEQQIRESVPPNVANQLDAAVRFAQQRGAGQGAQNVPPV